MREYIIQGARTIKLPITEPAVASLVESHVLERVGNLVQNTALGLLYNLKINAYADERLVNEMIDLPNDEDLSSGDIQLIHKNRPPFMIKLLRFKDILNI